MAVERKSTMLSGRVPTPLAERVNYVVRNTDSKTVNNRSDALREALEDWLPPQEERLRELGVLQKKTR